jgi:hypothetical protein
MLARDKHSTLLQKPVNHGRKKSYSTGPRVEVTDIERHTSLFTSAYFTTLKSFIGQTYGKNEIQGSLSQNFLRQSYDHF